MGLCGRFFTHFEQVGTGLSFSNIDENPFTTENFNTASAIYMMLISTMLYAILVWYLDNVMPG